MAFRRAGEESVFPLRKCKARRHKRVEKAVPHYVIRYVHLIFAGIMALILNLETASTNCSVSLAMKGRLLALREKNGPGYSHAEQLHVFIEEVITEAGKQMEALQAVAVSRGPGSYTGLRIGVSAAKGISYALDIPLISTPTLETMALQFPNQEAWLIPLLDARRMEVYSAIFNPQGEQLRETLAEVIHPDSFAKYSAQGSVYLLGSGAEKCRAVLQNPNFRFFPEVVPSAREMAGISYRKYQGKAYEDTAYFEPYYLKNFISR